MRLATRASWKRLGILLLALLIGLYCLWRMMIRMPLESYSGPWLPLDAREGAIEQELRRHVSKLSAEIGEHNIFVAHNYRAATDYVEQQLARTGREVRRQEFVTHGETCRNFEISLPGKAKAKEIVVIGAHYDSVAGCPGANDNSSGVAALFVLAQFFSNAAPSRTLRFVAFANEEPPFFQTAEMGSLIYAQDCRKRGDNIVAMLSLETLGYYTDEPRSQQYPFPFGLLYPSTGNFIAFVGNTRSRKLVRECIGAFRKESKFPSEGGALPGSVVGVGWSDHWSFWQAGYPAIMITDTAPFRYPYYHSASDTPEKLVYDRMARVVTGLENVIASLAK